MEDSRPTVAFQRVARVLRKATARVRDILLRTLFLAVQRARRPRSDYWCFSAWNDYSHTIDNPRAVFEEIKNDERIRKIILQKTVSPPPPVEGENVKFVRAESARGAYYLARSGIVLTGYAVRGITTYSRFIDPERHAVVQLWHGVPLKRIAHLFPGEDFWEEETRLYAAAVCSSERDRDVMARAFAPVPPDRVWLTGLPRNDLILKAEEELPADYRRHLAELDALLCGRRFVLYAPTWRESIESLYDFSGDERERLHKVLDRRGAVLGIRGHANVRRARPYASTALTPSIIAVDSFPDVNVLLRRAAILVTDYSSIYIDYILLDRPIIHFMYDLDEYVAERGFLYDLDEALGGTGVRDFESLIVALDTTLGGSDADRSRRAHATRLFHAHPRESSEKVVKRMREELGAGERRPGGRR